MTGAVEILAGALAIGILLKTLVNLINPKWGMKRAKMIMKNQALLIGIYIVFAAAAGYIVISAIGIVNTFAAVVFGASLIGLSFMMYPKEALKLTTAMRKDRKKMILALIVWLVLAIWTLYALFA
jgi:hypothetical protein